MGKQLLGASSAVQKMTKLEGSGRQKWKKAMTKTDGERLRVRVAWDGSYRMAKIEI